MPSQKVSPREVELESLSPVSFMRVRVGDLLRIKAKAANRREYRAKIGSMANKRPIQSRTSPFGSRSASLSAVMQGNALLASSFLTVLSFIGAPTWFAVCIFNATAVGTACPSEFK